MAFYYVRDNGVTFTGAATGDAGRETVERTGAWDAVAANSYPSVKSIFADQSTTGNTIVDEDVIVIAEDHVESYGVSTSLNVESLSVNSLITFKSVDITSQNTTKSGAKINSSSGTLNVCSRISNKNNTMFIGVDFNSASSVNIYARESSVSFYNCEMVVSDWANPIYNNNYYYYQCNYQEGTLQAGGVHKFIGGTVKLTSATLGVRDATVDFICCDFTGSTCSTVASYSAKPRYINCKLTASMMNLTITQVSRDNPIGAELYSCGTGDGYYFSGGVNYYFSYRTNLLAYLNYSYDDTNKASLMIETNSAVNKSFPAKVKLCEIPAQNLSTTDTTYRTQLLLDTDTVATLSDSECWVELIHPNNTSQALGVVASSRNADILSAGTELTVSAETWQGTLPTNTKAYQIDVLLNSASLANVTNGNIAIYVNVAVPNADVYFDPSVQIGT